VPAFASVETASATAAASAIDFDRFIAKTPNKDETALRFGCREHLHDGHAPESHCFTANALRGCRYTHATAAGAIEA